MKALILSFLLLSFGGFTFLSAQSTIVQNIQRLMPPTGKVNVVIDTDTYNEIDDQFAVVYGLLSPDKMKVEAIYAAPYFNSRSVGSGDGMEKSYEEILRILDKMELDPTDFAFKGSTKFMQENAGQPVQSPAATDLIQRAMAATEPLYVLTLGAPTNVASAIMLEPKIKDKIIVVWLGGKGHHWDTAFEFNLKQDIPASQVIFDSGVPLIQIPTQPVTSHLHTTLPEIEYYLKGRGGISDYLAEIYKDYYSDHYGKSKVIWDISAIAYIVEPKWFKTALVHSPILTDQITYSVDQSRHFIRYVSHLDRNGIYADLFRKIQNIKK